MESQKLKALAARYYTRHDIQRALVEQAAHKEIVPRYIDIFGKRPDVIEYEQDVAALAAKGATSFHCSEELWSNPLELSTQLSAAQLDKLRIGWQLILDIDCSFLEYSKIAAWLLCEALYFHGIHNFGLKYSGNTGFHIGLAFKAFPSQIGTIKVKDFFPQGPRAIAGYLKEMIALDLSSRILELSTLREIAEASNKPLDYFMKKRCKSCGEEPVKRRIIYIGKEKTEKEDLICPKCGTSYLENKERFIVGEEFSPFSILEIDTVLIASRHLYRMAYSLHEKTGLASIVIKPEQLKAFHPRWAKPDQLFVRPFLPEPEQAEAHELLVQALDWYTRQTKQTKHAEIKEKIIKTKTFTHKVSEELFPPCIKAALQGIKHDGRKRALFVLINFFRSLGIDLKELEKKLLEWNKLNYKPLKENYIATQLRWFSRQQPKLPPNCNQKSYYQDTALCSPEPLCNRITNPLNYVLLKARELEKAKTKAEPESKLKRKYFK